jgi:hypothetical protein
MAKQWMALALDAEITARPEGEDIPEDHNKQTSRS